MTTFDLIVKKFEGEVAVSLVPSAMVSMVSGLEFTVASTFIIKTLRSSSFKLGP